jgi:hypothetical protein
MMGSRSLLVKFHRDRFSTIRECFAMLIEHLDGRPVAFDASSHSRRRRMTRLLLDRRLLRLENSVTVITELGREALAAVLAEYAETLLSAHLAVGTARKAA